MTMSERRARSSSSSSAWVLNPSDFAFLYQECKRCFWEKVVAHQRRPMAPFPKIFIKIDRSMKSRFLGEPTLTIDAALPAGIIAGSRRVSSAPLWLPQASRPILIRGEIDTLVELHDGRLGILDFKTSEPRDDHLTLYGRQLHAYLHCCEHPAAGVPTEVTMLGLVVFDPVAFASDGPYAYLAGGLEFVRVNIDREAFSQFLSEVATVLMQPVPPPPGDNCPFCAYREAA
jgi:CRISPR/Cas system-associated exonuclease Cas4 (RecB family)